MKSQHKTQHFGLTKFQIATLFLFALADGGLAFILIRLLKIDVNTLLSYYFITAFILMIVSNLYLIRFSGSMKRGILVWREDLPKHLGESLRYMRLDMENDNGFIKVDGNLRLVYVHHWFWHTSWPYIAYIDLGVQSPKIDYRTGLGGVLFIIPFFVVFPPFALIMMGLNHFVERARIRGFISNNAPL